MGKSVKLTDGSYIDADYVWSDARSRSLNALLKDFYWYKLDNSSGSQDKTFTVVGYWTGSALLIEDQRSLINVYLIGSQTVTSLVEERGGYTPTVVYQGTASPITTTMTITLFRSSSAFILSTRALTITST